MQRQVSLLRVLGVLGHIKAERMVSVVCPTHQFITCILLSPHILVFSADRGILCQLNRKRCILGNHDSSKMLAVFMHACPTAPSLHASPPRLKTPQQVLPSPTKVTMVDFGKILGEQMTRLIGMQKKKKTNQACQLLNTVYSFAFCGSQDKLFLRSCLLLDFTIWKASTFNKWFVWP